MAQAANDILHERFEECRKVMESFEYFCDEYVWIEDKENKQAIKLTLWPAQREVLQDLQHERLLELIKTRQVGLTWLACALVLWDNMTSPLCLDIIISATEDHAIEFLDRVKFIRNRLPGWLLPPHTETKQQMEFRHADGLISQIKSISTTKMGAESKTPTRLIIDEAHTIREVETIYNSSYPGIEQAKGQVIVIANSVKTHPGWPWVRDTAQKSRRDENRFKLIFLPWMAHPGRPADFRERMVSDGMDEDLVREHYPQTVEEALDPAGGSFFGGVLSRHNRTCRGLTGSLVKDRESKEIAFVEDKRGIVELWRFPYYLTQKEWEDGVRWKARYCIGSDVSEGLGASYSVAYVMDRLSRELVSRIRSNRVDAHAWADLLELLSAYFERALLCVERTGAGITTIKRLEELKANQYVKIVPGTTGKGITSEIGWSESQANKWECCGDLKEFLKITPGRMFDSILVDECSTFIKAEGTMRLEPESGKYGDCVMAAAMTVECDKFLPKPEKIQPPLTGWRKRLQDERKPSPWAL